MRIMGLFLALLFALTLLAVPLSAQSSAMSTDDLNLLKRPSIDSFLGRQQFPTSQMATRRPYSLADQGSVCYTMRSYKVEQDEPGYDSTHAAGYTTCEPSLKYSVKIVDGLLREESDSASERKRIARPIQKSGGEGGIRTPDTR